MEIDLEKLQKEIYDLLPYGHWHVWDFGGWLLLDDDKSHIYARFYYNLKNETINLIIDSRATNALESLTIEFKPSREYPYLKNVKDALEALQVQIKAMLEI